MVITPGLYDRSVVSAAAATVAVAINAALNGRGTRRAVVVPAPAGAGKSHLIVTAVGEARREGLRVAVAAPTNEQVFGLVRAIAARHCAAVTGRAVTFVPASDVTLPVVVAALPGVREAKAKDDSGHDLIVGTLSKPGDAFAQGDLAPFDILLVDEVYQADSAKYFAVGDLAPAHLLVGDAGQINTFATVADPGRWRRLPEDPLQTAVGVLLRNHPRTPVHRLPITRRLDPRAAAVARLFYPDLPFAAAVLPGVRELRLDGRGTGHRLDAALDTAARAGWAHVELPASAVLQADPEAVALIVDLVGRLFERRPRSRCERQPTLAALAPAQVAVGVSHNDQKDHLRAVLNSRGLCGVVVETANKLQGLEFEVTIVWHPLSGLPEADEFHLDPGRLCVLLTRHRQACVVVGRAGDRDLIDDRPPPPTASYLGHDHDPVLDGWEVHRVLYAAPERVGGIA
jgi:hypothetical protein